MKLCPARTYFKSFLDRSPVGFPSLFDKSGLVVAYTAVAPTIYHMTQFKQKQERTANSDIFYMNVNLAETSSQAEMIVVPTPLEGEGTIYSNGFFFVQSILADRYIHRKELRLVSIESLYSVEYGIKKTF